MKDITFFITNLSQGGAERQLLTLAQMLLDWKYRVNIVTYGDSDDYYKIDSRISRIRLGYKKNRIKKLIEIYTYFAKCKTDIVVSFEERNNFFACISLLYRKKIRLISSERNFALNNNQKNDILRRLLYGRCDFIVPNSFSQGKYLEDRFPLFKSKIKVITNYTDLNKFNVDSKIINKKSSDIVSFCIFARYDPQKNYRLFADAIKSLVDRGIHNFHFDWYGKINDAKGIPTSSYIEFNDIIKSNNLDYYIELKDAVKDVENYYVQYDAFCLPSLFEGFSNSLSEAISSSLPAVVGNVSDNIYMVREGYNGMLFNPYNSDSIANALQQFIQLPEDERKIYGRNSRFLAVNLFRKEDFINKYLELIECQF